MHLPKKSGVQESAGVTVKEMLWGTSQTVLSHGCSFSTSGHLLRFRRCEVALRRTGKPGSGGLHEDVGNNCSSANDHGAPSGGPQKRDSNIPPKQFNEFWVPC